MKPMIKTINALTLILLVLVTPSLSQDYLVTAKGDTIHGELKPVLGGVDKKVIVIGENKSKTTYGILQIKSYQLDGDIFHTIRSAQGYSMMKLLKSGYLSLYAFQSPNQTSFDGLLLRKADGATLEVPNLAFKKLMSGFLQECPPVVDSVEAGKWGKRDIENIVDGFNRCIDKKTNNQNNRKEITVNEPDKKVVNKAEVWTQLEENVRSKSEFPEKTDVLDMIADVKGKMMRSEQIPNYLQQALRNALQGTGLEADVEEALKAR